MSAPNLEMELTSRGAGYPFVVRAGMSTAARSSLPVRYASMKAVLV